MNAGCGSCPTTHLKSIFKDIMDGGWAQVYVQYTYMLGMYKGCCEFNLQPD